MQPDNGAFPSKPRIDVVCERSDGIQVSFEASLGLTFSRGEIVARALSRVGEPYAGELGFHCERFVHWARTGSSVSGQVNRALVVGGLAPIRLSILRGAIMG